MKKKLTTNAYMSYATNLQTKKYTIIFDYVFYYFPKL